jgi:hypothetical protein
MGGGLLEWRDMDKYLGVVHHESCGIDAELSSRIKAAWAAFLRLRPLMLSRRPTKHMRGVYAQAFEALTVAVMLYGGEVWALNTAQMKRLEMQQCKMLRSALPARMRRWVPGKHRISNAELRRYFGIVNVATLLARRQLRYIGHLARMPETRVQRQLLRCWRLQPGRAAGGCKFPTLLGLFGKTDGVYGALVRTHLTPAVRRRFFGSGAPRQWFVNAQRRLTWRRFVAGQYTSNDDLDYIIEEA